MTTFIVNGQEKELRFEVDGIDISADFIGNTDHGMDQDEDGNFLASQQEYSWWEKCITRHEEMTHLITEYKEKFGSDEVDEVIWAWVGSDLEDIPDQVLLGLEDAFGSL